MEINKEYIVNATISRSDKIFFNTLFLNMLLSVYKSADDESKQALKKFTTDLLGEIERSSKHFMKDQFNLEGDELEESHEEAMRIFKHEISVALDKINSL